MQIALDGYALRFPRTGIVSYSYAVAKGYRERLREKDDLTILLSDRNVTDKVIKCISQSGARSAPSQASSGTSRGFRWAAPRQLTTYFSEHFATAK